MKRSTVRRFIVFMVLIGAILTTALFEVNQETPVAARFLASTSIAALLQVGNRFDHTSTTGGDYGGCFIVPHNPGPSFNCFPVKQSLPVWGNVSTGRRCANPGFFFAALVLLLFFRFYQNSRTSSEDDGSPTAWPIL